MRKSSYFLFLLLTSCFLILNSVSAAGLVPECKGGICTYCDFLALAQNIIKFLMEVSISISVIFIIYGAVMLMISSGSPERAQRSKAIITNAVIGVAIALGAWLIINTILIALTGEGSALGKNWWQIKCK